MFAEFGGQRPGHPGDGVFARGVVHHERLHFHACGGADQDDGAAATAVDDVVGAGDVDIDDVAPRFGGDRVPGLGDADTGVGHDDVEAAEGLDARVHRGAQTGGVPGVDGGGDDLASGVLDQPDGFREILRGRGIVRDRRGERRRDIDGDDIGALGRQPDGVRTTLTACGPGDERYFASKSARHVFS